jgi:transposase
MKQPSDKTDWTDARMLADLIRAGYLPKAWPAPTNVRPLRTLVRYRQQLVDQRRTTKLRITAPPRDGRPRHRAALALEPRLGRQAAELGTETRWVVNLNFIIYYNIFIIIRRSRVAAGNVVVSQVTAQQGVGRGTAATLRAGIGRCDQFTMGKQLARFRGLSPRNASSGSRQADAGLIQAGHPCCGRRLSRQRIGRSGMTPWRELARQLRGVGKPSNVIAAAVANRRIRWLFHQREGEPTPQSTHWDRALG